MALQVITGKRGSGKTTYAMNVFSSAPALKKVYIVPETSSFTAESLIAETFGCCSSSSVSVLSFNRLYTEMVNLYGKSGFEKLGKSGKTMLINHICQSLRDDFKILGKSAYHQGFSEIVSDSISEFKTHNITPDMLENLSETAGDESLRLKLYDLSLIYRKYQTLLENKFEDADDEMGILAHLIAQNPDYFADSLVVFDGFSFFSPNQFDVINEILYQAKDTYFTFTTDSSDFEDETDMFYSQKRTMQRIKTIAKKLEVRINEDIYLDECHKFKSFPELNHIANCLLSESDKKADASGNFKISAFNDISDEITYVARQIETLVRSGDYRYKDIVVIARNKEEYSLPLNKIFTDFGIPVFISGKQNALGLPAVSAVMSAINIILRNFSYESVFDYLKSGFTGISQNNIDLIENYITSTGIRGSAWLGEKDWEYTPEFSSAYENTSEFLALVNSIRKEIVSPLIILKNGLSEAKTVKEMCRAVYTFISEINLHASIFGFVERFKSSDMQTASYYAQVWNTLISVLDETADILGDEEINISGFYELLACGFSMHDIGVIPTAIDVVKVLSDKPEGSARVAFVIGVNDGVYPSVCTDSGLISDNDKKVFEENGMELSDMSYIKTFEESFVTYNILTFPEEKLEITYPISDMLGASLLPSRIISKLKNMFNSFEVDNYILQPEFPSSDMISSPAPTFDLYLRHILANAPKDSKWDEAGKWFSENPYWNDRLSLFTKGAGFAPKTTPLSSEVLDMIYKNNSVSLSVSRMELFSKCPFSYYLNYILRLKEQRESTLYNTDTGSIMHDVIEQLSVSIKSNGFTWKSVTDDFITAETERLVNKKIEEVSYMFGYQSSRRKWLLIRLKSTLMTSVKFVAAHLKAGEFIPLGYEIVFADNSKYTPLKINIDGKTISLKGKIDRADIFTDENGNKFVRVIDYKSGNRSFDVSNMYYGLELQLMVYLDRLCDLENASPAGILYFRFNDPIIDDGKGSVEDEFRMKGLVLNNDEVLHAMDKSGNAKSSVIPVSYLKDGSISKNSSVASAKQFAGMRKHLHSIIRQIGKEIAGGKTDIAPVKTDKINGCDYCSFKEACHFDTVCGGKYKHIDFLPKEDIINKLEKQGGEDNA